MPPDPPSKSFAPSGLAMTILVMSNPGHLKNVGTLHLIHIIGLWGCFAFVIDDNSSINYGRNGCGNSYGAEWVMESTH